MLSIGPIQRVIIHFSIHKYREHDRSANNKSSVYVSCRHAACMPSGKLRTECIEENVDWKVDVEIRARFVSSRAYQRAFLVATWQFMRRYNLIILFLMPEQGRRRGSLVRGSKFERSQRHREMRHRFRNNCLSASNVPNKPWKWTATWKDCRGTVFFLWCVLPSLSNSCIFVVSTRFPVDFFSRM